MSGSVDPDRTEWDVIVIGGGPPGENAAQYAIQGSGLTAVIVEPSWSAASAPTGRACPARRCCGRSSCSTARRAMPGVAARSAEARLDVDAVLARRDSHHQPPRRHLAGAVGARRRDRRDPRPRPARPGANRRGHQRRRQHPHAHRPARGRPRHRHPRGDPAGRRAARGAARGRPATSPTCTSPAPGAAIVGGGVVACESATWLHGLGVEELTDRRGGPRLLARNEPFAGELVADQSLRSAGVKVRARHHGRARSSGRDGSDDRRGTRARRRGDGHARRRRDDRRRRDRRRRRPHAEQRRHRPGDASALRATGRLRRRRRPPGRRRRARRLAVRGRRHHRPGAAHPHGQVPGADRAARSSPPAPTGTPLGRRRLQPHTRRRRPRRRPAGDVHRPGGRLGRAAPSEQARDGGHRRRDRRVRHGRGRRAVAAARRLRRAREAGDRPRHRHAGRRDLRRRGLAELVHAATVAVVGEVPCRALWHAVPSYPTVSEIWLRLLEALRGQRGTARDGG